MEPWLAEINDGRRRLLTADAGPVVATAAYSAGLRLRRRGRP
jgi:hypothetical protein